MAFIDDIGSKISNVRQQTAKAFSDKSELGRLKEAIAAEQGLIYQAQATIGETYFERYGDETKEEPFVVLCGHIRDSQAAISQLEDQLRMLQNLKACPQCGTNTAFESLFCASCGYAFPPPPAPEPGVGFCTGCGAALVPDAAFCMECGTKT